MTVNFQLPQQEFERYVEDLAGGIHPVLAEITALNETLPAGKMMIAPVQMRLLCWLARLIGTKNYLELGVFTGYSSTMLALNLPAAELYLCDINVTYTDHARSFWQAAGVAERCHLYLQPALITLEQMQAEGKSNFFDLVLIDADKAALAAYTDACLKLTRPGGVIAVDNTAGKGKVLHKAAASDGAALKSLRSFNRKIAHDDRFSPLLLPLGDGLTLLQKMR